METDPRSGARRLGLKRRAPQPATTLQLSARVVGIATGVFSQTAVLTAILYYFGWARANATFGYFGLDASEAGFSVADYVLRSISPTFTPLLLATLLLVACEYLDRAWIRPRVQHDSRPPDEGRCNVVRRVRMACWATQVLVTIAAAIEPVVTWPYSVLFPVGLAASSGIQLYIDSLVARYPWLARQHERGNLLLRKERRQLLLSTLLIVAVFWALGLYAAAVGRSSAVEFVDEIPSKPELEIFSTQRLAITGPGVTALPITQPDNKFRYVYRGLRLLRKSPSEYIILPAGWEKGRASVILLPADSSLRVDVATPG